MRGRVHKSFKERLWFWLRIRHIRARRFWRSHIRSRWLRLRRTFYKNRLTLRLHRRYRLAVRWWQRQNRRYGIWWRLGNGLVAVLLLVSIIIPVVQQLMLADSYELSADTLRLVGKTDPKLTDQLKYDAQNQMYQFNQSAVQTTTGKSNPLASMRAQIGTASGKGDDKSTYALDVPQNFSQGVTYTDTNTSLSFSLVPQFSAAQGKAVQGHLVFPLSDNRQAIYTLKNNGLKEDIVVQKATKGTMAFAYHLHLPDTLQAKVIPNSGGNIGIYSADPTLYGNISFGNSKDQAAIQKARVKGDKTNLVFGLPTPVIKDIHGHTVGDARFKLHGDTLEVIATGLGDIRGPFTIDPSVVVTSASDFAAGNNDGNITFDTTNNQITRGGLTGGSVGSWTTNTDTGVTPAGNYGQGIAAYDGYLYVVDGFASASSPYAIYAQIQSNGSLGAWVDATLPNTGRNYPGLVAYNSHLYLFGGYDRTNGLVSNTVESVAINSDGSLGPSWTTSANTMTYGVCRFGAAVYNGYLYAVGGANVASSGCPGGSTASQYVQYAPLNADGSVGAWTSSANQFATARFANSAAAYNGYLYVAGGANTGYGTKYSDVQYAKLGSDGSVGTWMTTTAMSRTRSDGVVVAYNGYLYAYSGITNSGGGTGSNDVMYAQINANGTLGAWQATTTFTNARFEGGGFVYNGYVYVNGGYNSGTSTIYNDTQYAQIDPAGVTTAYSTASGYANTTSRENTNAVAYNGFLYILGGDNGSAPTAAVQAAPINADGSIGTFSGTGFTNLPTASSGGKVLAYNGYMYYIVGDIGGGNEQCSSGTGRIYKAAINTSTGKIGGWSMQSANLPTADMTYCGFGAAAYNGYFYLIGGYRSNSFTVSSSVYYITINSSNGNLGSSWSAASYSLPAGMVFGGVAINGSTLYVAGGCTSNTGAMCNTATNKIYYTQIAASGDLSAAFTTNATTFTNARMSMAFYIVNGYMYIAGGYSGSGSTHYSDTQYAPINTDGSVGTWTTSSAGVLANAMGSFGYASYNGVLYVAGGTNGSAYYNTVQYTYVNNGGSGNLGTWATGNSFTTPRIYFGTVAYNGFLYVLGGENTSGTTLSDVQVASINGDGSISSWSTTGVPALPAALMAPGVVAYNGFLYVLGGATSSTVNSTVATTYFAKINADGTLGDGTTTAGTWLTGPNMPGDPNDYNSVTYEFTAVAYNGYLYQVGGNTCSGNCRSSSTRYAPINSDGSIGTWQLSTYLPETINVVTSFAADGYIYTAGANSTTGLFMVAPLNGNGSIGSWSYTGNASTDLTNGSVNYYNGFVYYVGGEINYTSLATTYYAPVGNGYIGAWQQATNDFTPAREFSASAVYDGYLYAMGGFNLSDQSTYFNDVEYAPISSIARIGHYSKVVDLGVPTNVSGITYTATGQASVSFRAAGSDGVFGSLTSASAITPGATNCLAGSQNYTRYLWLDVTLDDSATGIFADANLAPTAVTDITVNYTPVHPPPNIRLRLGQTLQTGNLSPFDTCYP